MSLKEQLSLFHWIGCAPKHCQEKMQLCTGSAELYLYNVLQMCTLKIDTL